MFLFFSESYGRYIKNPAKVLTDISPKKKRKKKIAPFWTSRHNEHCESRVKKSGHSSKKRRANPYVPDISSSLLTLYGDHNIGWNSWWVTIYNIKNVYPASWYASINIPTKYQRDHFRVSDAMRDFADFAQPKRKKKKKRFWEIFCAPQTTWLVIGKMLQIEKATKKQPIRKFKSCAEAHWLTDYQDMRGEA